jgi:hypothetical protein
MTRQCYACGKNLDRNCYSNNQWRKGNEAKCRACVNGGSSRSAGIQKRMRLDTARNNISSKAQFNTYDLNHPFAEGAFRWVAKGTYTEGDRRGEACVCKWFKKGHHFEESYFREDVKAVEKAIDIIQQFNQSGLINKHIRINRAAVWTFQPGSIWSGRKVLQEPFIENWVKFNSNTGWADDSTNYGEVMQALSHFSYHVSTGKFVLCDLQGGMFRDGVVLTDPVILSRTKSYGVTDLGADGISNFFARHKCNRFCKKSWQQPRDQQVKFNAYKGTSMVGAGHATTHHSKQAMTHAFDVVYSDDSDDYFYDDSDDY